MLPRVRLIAISILTVATFASAQQLAVPSNPAATTAAAASLTIAIDTHPHPLLSGDSSWAGVMIIIVMGTFLAAGVIGPIVQANTPDEVPPSHAHDEPPGSSGHHGISGTE